MSDCGRLDWPPPGYQLEITEQEFELARAEAIERFGTLPPSLQRVIDVGGRFARACNRARIEEEYEDPR
jgi:hypothetical protein